MREPPGNHEAHDRIRRAVMQDMVKTGLYKPPAHEASAPKKEKEKIPAD
jgi:hypothetical protein